MQTNLSEQTSEHNTKFHPLKKPGDWSHPDFQFIDNQERMNMSNLSNQSTNSNSPEFLLGDAVVFTPQKYKDVLLEVVGFSGDPELLKVKSLKTALCGYVFIEDLRHATVAEIKAKQRLAAPVALFVSDIEMHYQRALESQREVS